MTQQDNRFGARAVQLTQKLVQRPSVTPQDAGTFRIIQPLLEGLGFSVTLRTIQDVTNLFATHVLRAPNGGHAQLEDNACAENNKHGFHLLFLGHTDVVPAPNPEQWTHPPFSGVLDDTGVLWGRGTADMKGAIAAFITALESFLPPRDTEQSAAATRENSTDDTFQKIPEKKLKAHDSCPHALSGRISLLLTSDEEGPAVHGTKAMADWLEKNHPDLFPIDLCLVGEPTSDKHVGDTLKVGRRGSLTGRLTLHGCAGHAAYPNTCDNPLHRLPSLLQALGKPALPAKSATTTCSRTDEKNARSKNQFWGQLDAGCPDFDPSTLSLTGLESFYTASNVTPAEAAIFFSIRFNPLHTEESLTQHLTHVAHQHAGQHTLNVTLNGAPYATQAPDLIAQIQKTVGDICDSVPKLCTSGGTSDGRFMTKIAPVIELGLRNHTIHKINEQTTAEDLRKLTHLYLALLKHFFKI